VDRYDPHPSLERADAGDLYPSHNKHTMEGVAVFSHIARSSLRRAGHAAIACLAFTAIELTAGAASAEDNWTFMPGGIAKLDGTIAYVAGSGDTVEAIDMANGQPIWDSKKAIRPLAITENSIVAVGQRVPNRPNTIVIVTLDPATGALQKESQIIEFPDWVAVDGGIGLQFASTASVENGDLVIRWQAVRQSIQPGPKVTAEVIAASRRNSTGVARVNLETGEGKVTEDGVLSPPNIPRLGKFTDVGSKRLRMTEATERVPGGITLLRRTIEAADKVSGRPMWQHEVASDVILPDVPPQQLQQQVQQGMQQQQQQMQQQQRQPQQPQQQTMRPRQYPQR
jgi:hypothetical protein